MTAKSWTRESRWTIADQAEQMKLKSTYQSKKEKVYQGSEENVQELEVSEVP